MSTVARAAEIAAVLTKHGLFVVLDVSGLGGRGRHRHADVAPAHVRAACEELGPTFMKLGQILSTRPDLVPPEFETELARLQDCAPTVPFAAIDTALHRGLGHDPREVFASFERHPIAAASIGQVHGATLPDGSPVAVKIRRPGVMARVEEDLALIARGAALAARNWELADRYDPEALAAEFSVTLRNELDYAREGQNCDRIREELRDQPRVHVPVIHWAACGDGVLTMERCFGIKITDVDALDAAGIDRPAVARDFALLFLGMVFRTGFFHADPHPGNVLVESDGTLALLDYGMVGTVPPELRLGMGKVLMAVATHDATLLADALGDLGVATSAADHAAMVRDLDDFLQKYRDAALGTIEFSEVLDDLMEVVRRNHLRMPRELALLFKTVMMCEGVAQKLDPSFQLAPVILPLVQGH
ncbi:MAG: ABC1 kinase family protein [Acidimicrobiia bacterium]